MLSHKYLWDSGLQTHRKFSSCSRTLLRNDCVAYRSSPITVTDNGLSTGPIRSSHHLRAHAKAAYHRRMLDPPCALVLVPALAVLLRAKPIVELLRLCGRDPAVHSFSQSRWLALSMADASLELPVSSLEVNPYWSLNAKVSPERLGEYQTHSVLCRKEMV